MRHDDRIADSFRRQAAACRRLGSPFTARLCMVMREGLPPRTLTAWRVRHWPGDPVADGLPLRLAAALHHLVRSGAAPALAAVFPPCRPTEADLRRALADVVEVHDAGIAAMLDRKPQTGEVARSAVLLGGLMAIAEQGLPVELLQIGAGAGLDLLIDHWRYELGRGLRWGAANAPLAIRCDWRGEAPAIRRLSVADRAGVDTDPADPRDRAAREWLLAQVGADQAGRLARTSAALAHAARHGARIERGDAPEWLERRLAVPHERGCVRVLMHSMTWQTLAPAAQRRLARAMVAYGLATGPERPLAWLRFEPDGAAETAAVMLTTWPGGRTRDLGRADLQGRYAVWSGER